MLETARTHRSTEPFCPLLLLQQEAYTVKFSPPGGPLEWWEYSDRNVSRSWLSFACIDLSGALTLFTFCCGEFDPVAFYLV
jgi:hypothetical protein